MQFLLAVQSLHSVQSLQIEQALLDKQAKKSVFAIEKQVAQSNRSGSTKHSKELQGTENSSKNYKELQDTFKRSTVLVQSS